MFRDLFKYTLFCCALVVVVLFAARGFAAISSALMNHVALALPK